MHAKEERDHARVENLLALAEEGESRDASRDNRAHTADFLAGAGPRCVFELCN